MVKAEQYSGGEASTWSVEELTHNLPRDFRMSLLLPRRLVLICGSRIRARRTGVQAAGRQEACCEFVSVSGLRGPENS
jgi:hypothetical protein